MKLDGGHWLFWVSAIYLELGIIDLFVHHFTEPTFITMAYVIALSLPLYIPTMAHFFNVKCIWEA